MEVEFYLLFTFFIKVLQKPPTHYSYIVIKFCGIAIVFFFRLQDWALSSKLHIVLSSETAESNNSLEKQKVT